MNVLTIGILCFTYTVVYDIGYTDPTVIAEDRIVLKSETTIPYLDLKTLVFACLFATLPKIFAWIEP